MSEDIPIGKIEKIACPILNRSLVKRISSTNAVSITSPRGEVFIEFTPSNQPTHIMCPEYNLSKMCDLEKKSCIYNGWKDFSF